MLLGVIADDFTGASDIANTLVKGAGEAPGMNTSLYLGIPDTVAEEHVEAGVVALKSRSIPVTQAIEQSLAALDWLLKQGALQIVFKYCSTFDSTPMGNIGPVAEALAAKLDVKGVVVCPAFPTTGRTLYQSHLFVNDRLLNESGLQYHPLNPMTDADIRRWLQLQSKNPVGQITLDTVSKGAQAVSTALKDASQKGETLVVVDAVSDQNLLTIGAALADARLITGGSGIAMGLPENFRQSGQHRSCDSGVSAVPGPAAILAGSCSQATLRQIAVHAQKFPVLSIDVEEVMKDNITEEHLLDFINSNLNSAPLVYSSNDPVAVSALQKQLGREEIAHKLDRLFALTARRLIDTGFKNLVVAGGETSGAVVSALNPGSLVVGREIDPGVPTLYACHEKHYGLALKSGNFGSENFFEKALNLLSGSKSAR